MHFSIKTFSGLVIFSVCLSALQWSAPPARAQAKTPVVLYQQSKTALETKDFQQAIVLLKQAVALDGKNVKYKTSLADAHFYRADKLRKLYRWDEAIREYQAAYAIDKIYRRGDAGVDLNNIGVTHNDLSQYAKALESFNQALPIYREVGDRHGESVTLGNIGNAYSHLNQYEKAIEYYNLALPTLRGAWDQEDETTTLLNIGNAYGHLGQYEKALEYFDKALFMFQEV